MIRPDKAQGMSGTATGIVEQGSGLRFVHWFSCGKPLREEVCTILFHTVRPRARTGKARLRPRMARPDARRRKPQGKRGWAGDAAGKSGKKRDAP